MTRTKSYEELKAENDQMRLSLAHYIARQVRMECDEVDKLRQRVKDLEATLAMTLKMPDKERRQWFIKARLKEFGYVNRSDIMDTFNVSMPQSSIDLKEYRRRRRDAGLPPDMWYNAAAKRYEAL